MTYRILFALLFSAYLLSFPSSFRRWAHPFHPPRFMVDSSFHPEWEVEPSPEEKEKITQILSQPFFYIGKGLQSYAFESQDGEYVVKLFRFDPCKAPFGQRFVRWAKDLVGKSSRVVLPVRERMAKTFGSCLLSYQKLSEETGVIWVHLNPKKDVWPLLQLRDRMHQWHSVDAGQIRFALQKKGTMLKPALEEAYRDDLPKFHRMLASFAQLILTLEEKGVYNLDPKMASNFGFIGDKAFQIDFGNFTEDQTKALYHANHYSNRLRGMLEKYMPEGVATIDEAIH